MPGFISHLRVARLRTVPHDTWAAVAVAAIGLALRVVFSFSPGSIVGSDEAITSLMAISVTKGEFPFIVGGNNYGGVLEAYILALPVALMRALKLVGGASLLLDAVNIALHALLFWTLLRVYRRFLSLSVSLLLIAPMWLMSAACIVLSTESYLGYVTGVLAAVISVGLLLDEQPSKLSEYRTKQTIVAGFCAGVAFWQHPLVGIAPLAVLVVASVTHLVRFKLAAILPLVGAVGATLLGALPFVWRAIDKWGDLPLENAPLYSTGPDRVRFVFSEHLPRSFGLRTITGQWLVPGSGIWIPSLLALVFVASIVVNVRNGRVAALGLLAIPALMASAPATVWVYDGRYGFLIAAPITISFAAALQTWKPNPPRRMVTVALGVAALLGCASISQNAKGFQWQEDDMMPVVALLDSRKIDAVRGDYWAVYRIAHISSERIGASDWDFKRIARLEKRVAASSDVAYVLVSAETDHRVPDRETLERLEVGKFIVYLPKKSK